MWLCTSQQLEKITVTDVPLLSTEVTVVNSARNLGVIIDIQLRQLRLVTESLSADAAKTLMQAFISTRLNYCNALLSGVSGGLMCRLQSVQNTAMPLVTGARHRNHITPILRQLYWLLVHQRVTSRSLSWSSSV